MKRLSKDQIQFIDNYLIKHKVTFLDVRAELLDHIISVVEEKVNKGISFNEALLDAHKSFGNKLGNYTSPSFEKKLYYSNKGFKKFLQERHKAIHWSCQKQLWRRVLMFFYKPKGILLTVILLAVMFFSLKLFNEKTIKYIFLFSIALPSIFAFFSHFKKSKFFKKIQSSHSLFGIMSLPSLFLYCLSPLMDVLFSNNYLLIGYWLISILFNLAGLFEIYKGKNDILKKYSILLK